VALTYITGPQLVVASFGHCLVLANADENTPDPTKGLSTFTIALQPNLSIVHVKLEQTQEV